MIFTRSRRKAFYARAWSDIPHELLQQIADRLTLVELLSFRSVCKDWRLASSTASAACEYAVDKKPWFLLYNDDDSSYCRLYSPSFEKVDTIDIPELYGTTCIASKGGWLLLVQESSIFFFCPFSRARIDLPKLPYPDLSDHVATFSSPPTSPDCVVCVINHSYPYNIMEVNMIERGANEWWAAYTKDYDILTITGATWDNRSFQFFDSENRILEFSPATKLFFLGEIVTTQYEDDELDEIFLIELEKQYFSNKSMMEKKLVLEQGDSLSTCGTTILGNYHDIHIHNENLGAKRKRNKPWTSYKGVWIHPRFFKLPPNQSW